MQKRATTGWLLLFVPVTALFYWKILLTRQFSLLTDHETVSQGYSWMHFTINSIRHGRLPIWDPYTLSGHSFPGEMQTAAFYPIHLLLALFPFNHASVLSPVTYHVWFAVTHVLAACFMFSLMRELGLSRFSAFIGGICYSLGGFVAHMAWPHLLESATWLPLVFLFLVRALRASSTRLAAQYACIGGLMLGMSVLAGGLQVVLMELLVIASAGIYYACAFWSERGPEGEPERQSRSSGGLPASLRAAIAVSVLGVVGLAVGAVQLFPSIEYSAQALRFLAAHGVLPANEPIPYADMDEEFLPHGIALLVAPFAFNGKAAEGEAINPYMGVFPLLAAIIGIRRYWRNRWVRYLAGLAVCSFLFAMGNFSWLHGVMYATIPKLWVMREASRMVFVTGFALAILAAYGVEALILKESGWPGLNRTLLGIVIACGAALFVPGMFGKPDTNPWNALSILMIFASYGLYQYMEHGNRSRGVQAMMIGLILFDLSTRDWTAVNRIELTRDRVDYLDQLMSARGAAQFLNAQPGLFRVQIQTDLVPNIGDLFGVPMIHPGRGATIPIDYMRILGYTDLLNVRYILAPAKEQKPRTGNQDAVYQDKDWKVYENPSGYPRAWTVHETMVEPSAERAAKQLETPGFDARRTALTEVPVALEPLTAGAQEAVQASMITPTRMELQVDAQSRALLVLSENYYPGWHATIDGQTAPIYRVDSALRGLVVPRGHSRVVLSYAPASIYWGGLLTSVAFIGTVVAIWLRNRRVPAI